jgi:hypothetical protein
MAKGSTVRVRIDAELLREVRRILGARSNRQAVELAITIALAIRGPRGQAAKSREILCSHRFKILVSAFDLQSPVPVTSSIVIFSRGCTKTPASCSTCRRRLSRSRRSSYAVMIVAA